MKKTKLILPLIGMTALTPIIVSLVGCNKKGGEELPDLCFEKAGEKTDENPTIQYNVQGLLPDIQIQTCVDGKTWNNWAPNTPITIENNQKLYVRNTSSKLSDKDNYFKFVMNNQIKASGNVDSMINYGNLYSYCFNRMFLNCHSLTETPKLPTTAIKDHCYFYMFSHCTALTIAPELPAETLAESCYENMFYGCSSLTQTPTLPAGTLTKSCYSGMFEYCTSLKYAPTLPSTRLEKYCYQSMFRGCTSLESAPTLPAEVIKDHCYDSMFRDCTSLTVAPELPGSLTISNSTSCYFHMFDGCTSLVQAPQILPSQVVCWNCYDSMFLNYTSLTETPELPCSEINRSDCYKSMFQGCTNLRSIKKFPILNYVGQDCMPLMFANCTSLQIQQKDRNNATEELILEIPADATLMQGAVIDMFKGCQCIDFDGTPTINHNYYLELE